MIIGSSYGETRRHFEREGDELGVNRDEADASNDEVLVEAGVDVGKVGREAQSRYLLGSFAIRQFLQKLSRLLHAASAQMHALATHRSFNM